jgi:hypothetical protein
MTTTLCVFDPAMCCSTGVCGPSVDPELARFAADLDWLKVFRAFAGLVDQAEQGFVVIRGYAGPRGGGAAGGPPARRDRTLRLGHQPMPGAAYGEGPGPCPATRERGPLPR